jgi:hypothetical protein
MRQWTHEERLRQAELIRNWQPWKRSTGAKTPEGKARSSQNAYKHGISNVKKKLSWLLNDQKNIIDALSQFKSEKYSKVS